MTPIMFLCANKMNATLLPTTVHHHGVSQQKWGVILLVAVGLGVGAAVVFGTQYGMVQIACECAAGQRCCGHLCYNSIIQFCCGDYVVNVTSHC